ncbi:hypothetical protein S245_032058, partial [Arachis hypogaea]
IRFHCVRPMDQYGRLSEGSRSDPASVEAVGVVARARGWEYLEPIGQPLCQVYLIQIPKQDLNRCSPDILGCLRRKTKEKYTESILILGLIGLLDVFEDRNIRKRTKIIQTHLETLLFIGSNAYLLRYLNFPIQASVEAANPIELYREPLRSLYSVGRLDLLVSGSSGTNCGPFIDFLGEKDAGVSGLDDISSEVDIMKEKGKTVDDSVPVDGECNLEIEVLLNSPPTETTELGMTEVLFVVLDGSPVHVIKKETAENLSRSAK